MTVYVLRDGKLVDKALAAPLTVDSHVSVISDSMEPTRHMADGKYYTSKAKFRQTTRAYGCVEIGNDVAPLLKPRQPVPLSRDQRRHDIRRAIDDLRRR